MPLISAGTTPPPTNPGAPIDAAYVLAVHDLRLPQHRRLAGSGGVTIIDGGPLGDITVDGDAMAAIGRTFTRWVLPSIFSSAATIGVGIVLIGAMGSIAAPTASRLGQITRTTAGTAGLAGVNTINGTQGIADNGVYWRGNAQALGGFYFRWIFGIETVTATMKWFLGMKNATANAAIATVPSQQINCFGIGRDEGDTQISLMHNDGLGFCNKVPLGVDFPVTQGEVYTLDLFCNSNDTKINYRLTRLGGPTVAANAMTFDIPVNTMFMAPYQFVVNGQTGSPGVANLAFIYMGSTQPYLQ